MSAFGKLLRAGKRCSAASVGAWSEFFPGGNPLVSGRGFCVGTAATPSSETIPEVAKLTPAEAFAADAEASLDEVNAKEPPPIDEFLESLGISQDKWKSQTRKPVSRNLRLNMGVLEKYGTALETRRRMVLATSASLDTLRRASPMMVERKMSWLMNEYEMNGQQAVKLITRHPPLVNYAIETNMSSFLTMVMKASAVEKKNIKFMLLAHPQIIGYGKKFEQLVNKAELLLGMDRAQVAKCVVKCPRLLSYSIDTTTDPIIRKLLGLGLTKQEVIQVFMDAPKLIGRSFHLTVDGKIDWLTSSELGLTREQAITILKKYPMAYYPKVESWVETKEWFMGLQENHTVEDFARFLSEVDFALLGRRKEGLGIILGFCLDVLKRETEAVLKCPQIFKTSFLTSTLPRVAFIDSKGKDVKEVPLEHLASSSREEFFKDFDMVEVDQFEDAFRGLKQGEKIEAIKTSTYPSSPVDGVP